MPHFERVCRCVQMFSMSRTKIFCFCIILATIANCENVKSKILVDKCGVGETCVRFCCADAEFCSDENVFNLSSLQEARNIGEDYRIFEHRLDCEDWIIEEDQWMFLPVITTNNNSNYWKTKLNSKIELDSSDEIVSSWNLTH